MVGFLALEQNNVFFTFGNVQGFLSTVESGHHTESTSIQMLLSSTNNSWGEGWGFSVVRHIEARLVF